MASVRVRSSSRRSRQTGEAPSLREPRQPASWASPLPCPGGQWSSTRTRAGAVGPFRGDRGRAVCDSLAMLSARVDCQDSRGRGAPRDPASRRLFLCFRETAHRTQFRWAPPQHRSVRLQARADRAEIRGEKLERRDCPVTDRLWFATKATATAVALSFSGPHYGKAAVLMSTSAASFSGPLMKSRERRKCSLSFALVFLSVMIFASSAGALLARARQTMSRPAGVFH